MFEFLRVETELLHYFLGYKFFGKVIDYHDSWPIDLPVLDFHLFRKEVGIEPLEVVRVWFVQDFACFFKQKDELLFDDNPFSLYFSFFDWFGRFDLQGGLEEQMELYECKFIIEDASIEE